MADIEQKCVNKIEKCTFHFLLGVLFRFSLHICIHYLPYQNQTFHPIFKMDGRFVFEMANFNINVQRKPKNAPNKKWKVEI